MRFQLIVLSLIATSALAEEVPAEAQGAFAEAQALLRAQLPDDALAAADRACTLAPDWGPPVALRARLNEPKALSKPVKKAAKTFDENFDYPTAILRVEVLLKEAEGGPTLRELESADLEYLKDLASRVRTVRDGLTHQHTTTRAEIARQREEERARREAEAKAAKEAIVRAEYDTAMAGATTQRVTGVVIGSIGLVSASVGVATLVAAATAVDDVKQGRLATARLYEGKLAEAGTLRAVSLLTGIIGAAGLATGAALFFTAKTPPPMVTVDLVPGGASVSVSAVF